MTKRRSQMTAAERARDAVLMIEIPAGELAVRIAEQAMGVRRPAGATPEQALADMDRVAPGTSAAFLKAAAAAVFFMRECILDGKSMQ